MAKYTFGVDGAAVERLRLVSAAYEPVSRAFLVRHALTDVDVAVDLGCGPGFSTRLLGQACAPSTLVGLDASPRFLEHARALVPSARFETHDATRLPLPGAPATVLYARLLLAHLPDPLGVVAGWRTALAPRGLLLVEDLEDIDAPPGPLRTYDELSAEVVRGGGGLMYAGRELAPLGGTCTPVTVPAAVAATIYLFNVRQWLAGPQPPVPRERLEALGAGLRAVADAGGPATVSWIVRQIAVPATRSMPRR